LFLLISIYFCFLFQFTVRCFLNTTVCFLKIVHCSKKFSVSSFQFRVKKAHCSLFTVYCSLLTANCIVHCSKKFSVSSFQFRVKKVQKCSLFNVNIMDKTNIPSRFFLLFHCWLPSMIACKHKFLLVLYVRLFYHPNLLADYLFRIF